MDEKIQEIAKRRNFQSFWECVDYLILASYEEVDVLMIALDLFEGKIWDSVITVAKYTPSVSNPNPVMAFASGATYTLSGGTTLITNGTGNYSFSTGSNRTGDEEDLFAHIYVITDEGNLKYKEIYKSYIETREYQEIKKLENQYKKVSINLKSELAIRLFNDGYSKYK